jgi:hypothetical protein
MSEHVLPLLDGLFSALVMLAFLSLLTFTGKYFDWFAPPVIMSWVVTIYVTAGKLTNTRLPGITLKFWIVNLLVLHTSILMTAALSGLTHGWLKSVGVHPGLSFLAASFALVATAIASWRLMRRFHLLQPTVGEVSHIETSISRLLDEFKQSTLPPHKAMVVRFTSDEASLLLAIAQATVKLIDFLVKAVVAFFTVFSFEFWRAARKRLGIVDRIAWLAVLAAALFLLTHSILGFAATVFGLLFAATGSIIDAIIQMKAPDSWNFSKSLPIQFFNWLEPHLAWSVDFSSGKYTTNPLVLALAFLITVLTTASLALSLPFGATSFWGSLYVNFSVESAPIGSCQIVTFTPERNGAEFWTESPLAHSLAYSDPRSIEAVCERVSRWIGEPMRDTESSLVAAPDAA